VAEFYFLKLLRVGLVSIVLEEEGNLLGQVERQSLA
jgi:hypothetical protein